MKATSNYSNKKFGVCAGRGCTNKGYKLLKIKYIGRVGYFCDSCTDELLRQDLATKDSGIIEIRSKLEYKN